MKQKIHANSIIYMISLISPVVLTTIVILICVIAHFYMGNGYKQTDLWLAWTMTTVFCFCLFMLIPIITYSILSSINIYRMWNAVNDGKSRMTPNEAIGFLFVPFYNFYWLFQVWGGFPADYNAMVYRYQLQQKVPYLKDTLYRAFPILVLLSGFIITIPILLIVYAIVQKRTNIALDDLQKAVIEPDARQVTYQPAQNVLFMPQHRLSA